MTPGNEATPDFTLRPAQTTDAAQIRALVQQARINPMGLKWQRFIIAVDIGGKVIGCGQIKPHAGGARELASIVSAPRWRRKGVARAIIQTLLASESGTVYLTCRAGLGAFYQRFGFVAVTEGLPPYFKQAMVFGKAMQRLGVFRQGLLVMRWED